MILLSNRAFWDRICDTYRVSYTREFLFSLVFISTIMIAVLPTYTERSDCWAAHAPVGAKVVRPRPPLEWPP